MDLRGDAAHGANDSRAYMGPAGAGSATHCTAPTLSVEFPVHRTQVVRERPVMVCRFAVQIASTTAASDTVGPAVLPWRRVTTVYAPGWNCHGHALLRGGRTVHPHEGVTVNLKLGLGTPALLNCNEIEIYCGWSELERISSGGHQIQWWHLWSRAGCHGNTQNRMAQ